MIQMSTLTDRKGNTYEIVDNQARADIKRILELLGESGGDITPDPEVETYNVTYDIEGVTLTVNGSAEHPTRVLHGSRFYGVITIPNGYDLTECLVMMGGQKITVSAREFDIAEVTADISITLTGVKSDTSYKVLHNLSEHITIDNDATSVLAGDSYAAILDVDSGYKLTKVQVFMGDVLQEGAVVEGMDGTAQIHISEVTGIIIIMAQAASEGAWNIDYTGLTEKNISVATQDGSVLPAAIENGDTLILVLTAETGYSIDTVYVYYGDTQMDGLYNSDTGVLELINIDGDVTFIPRVREVDTYTVQAVFDDGIQPTTTIPTVVGDGATLSFMIVPIGNYEIGEVQVLMGGTDVTATCYSGSTTYGNINIASVTGDVTVIARAVLKEDSYEVEYNTPNVSTVHNKTSGSLGETFAETLVADQGYTITSVTVTMSGFQVAGAYDATTQTVTVKNVSGKIKITTITTTMTNGDWSITRHLTDVTDSSTATNIVAGMPYSSTLSVGDGYNMESVKVYVGGVDKTSEYYNADTGAIVISSDNMNHVIIIAKAVKVHTVTLDFENIYTPVYSPEVIDGSTLNIAVTPVSGYGVLECTATMGGEELPPSNVLVFEEGGSVYIESVTGDVVISARAVKLFTVTHNFNEDEIKATDESDNTITGQSYGVNLNPVAGYKLASLTVTMAGEDINEKGTGNYIIDSVEGIGVVWIDSVTGDIVITATAEATE